MDASRVSTTTLFLGGDVMTGRGVDQILAHPGNPVLHEPTVRDARSYVALAEQRSGAIPRRVDASYVWGDAIAVWNQLAPDFRVVNLESSITRSDDFWNGKSVHYRMSPENVGCLVAAKIDCCALANNHVLDWGCDGLLSTLHCLRAAGISTAGAGRNRSEAEQPAILGGRAAMQSLAIFSLGSESSGIPTEWEATQSRAGVWLVDEASSSARLNVQRSIERAKRDHDRVMVSLHWGANWGYDVPAAHVRFAHALVNAGADVIHGHSSHHPRAIEVYKHRLILYGCGDFIDDYEGIPGYEEFRDDLALGYFAFLDRRSGELESLRMVPMQIAKLRLHRAPTDDAAWLAKTLTAEGKRLGTSVAIDEKNELLLRW